MNKIGSEIVAQYFKANQTSWNYLFSSKHIQTNMFYQCAEARKQTPIVIGNNHNDPSKICDLNFQEKKKHRGCSSSLHIASLIRQQQQALSKTFQCSTSSHILRLFIFWYIFHPFNIFWSKKLLPFSWQKIWFRGRSY